MKQKLFLDFDGTIVDTASAIIELYEEDFKDHKDFFMPEIKIHKKWNFTDICPLLTQKTVFSYFGSERLFEKLDFFNNNKFESDMFYISKLNLIFDLYIITLGSQENISLKSKFISNNIPGIKTIYLFQDEHCTPDKSVINMQNSIFVDDNLKNLESSNASEKIIFGLEKEYNIGTYFRTKTMEDLYNYLEK